MRSAKKREPKRIPSETRDITTCTASPGAVCCFIVQHNPQRDFKLTMFDPQLSPEHIVDSFSHPGKGDMVTYSHSMDNGVENESRREPIMPRSPTAPVSGPSQRTGRWTPDEKLLFLYGLKRFGKGRWKKMSVYLPNRSLVQIKSHAQKVLKRLEAGENVFRKLEESYHIIDSLVVQAARQHEALSHASIAPRAAVQAARRKKHMDNGYAEQQLPRTYTHIMCSGGVDTPKQPPVDGDVAALAASALCQLSSLPN